MDRWGSCADLLKNRRLLGCRCNLVKKMEFNALDSQNLLTEVLSQLQGKIRPVTQGVERPVGFFPATGLLFDPVV